MESDKPKYACPHCDGVEFITGCNSYDVYEADGNELRLQKSESSDLDEGALFCRECGERAPEHYEDAAC